MKSNKGLWIILGILAAIFSITHLFRNQKASKVFQKELVTFKADNIEKIHIQWPKDSTKTIHLSKQTGGQWFVQSHEIDKNADNETVKNLIEELVNLNIDRLISKSKNKWQHYHVSDSTGISLTIESKGEKATLYIGEKNGKNEYFYGSGIPFYVRVHGDKNVYLAKGILPTMLSDDANNWKNKTFIEVSPSDINGLSFRYGNDNFELIKSDTAWIIDDHIIDSTTIETYLNNLSQKIIEFGDEFIPDSEPNQILNINRENLDPIEVKGFKKHSDYYLESSLNPNNYAKANQYKFEKLFVPKEHFLK